MLTSGLFESATRAPWPPASGGLGSDLDLILIVDTTQEEWMERARRFDATELPVPVDLLVYTEAEWEGMSSQGRGPRPVVWIDETRG